jgi:hypothetical protein
MFGIIEKEFGCKIKNVIRVKANLMTKDASYPDGFYGLGAWLKTKGALASELGWVRNVTGGLHLIKESNAKGLADNNTAIRKGINCEIQSLGAVQMKLGITYAVKALEELNEKYASSGRQARLIAPVHDR